MHDQKLMYGRDTRSSYLELALCVLLLGVKRGGGAKLPSAENISVLVSVLEDPIHGVMHKTQL